MEKDSFCILKDFYYEGPNGGRENEIMDFVEVLDTGFVKLYKHYANIKSESGPTSPMLVWKKNTKKFKEQMLRYFQHYPEFVSRIEADAYSWESVPLLIKEFNEHKRLITSRENP